MCSSEADLIALDGFPLYWVREVKLKKAKTLDELNSADREICQVLASLGIVFNTAKLIKHEYDLVALTRCIGMGVIPSLLLQFSISVYVVSSCILSNCSYTTFMACLTHNTSSLVQTCC